MRAVEQLASGTAAAGKSSLDRWENMTQWSEDLVQRAQALFQESGAAGSSSNNRSRSSSTCEPETETTTTTTTEQPLSLSLIQSKCRELEARIQELATCRDEANASEHKVRRGLYRLATGRMTLDEVIKVRYVTFHSCTFHCILLHCIAVQCVCLFDSTQKYVFM
jgi:hypothetical protein